MTAAKNIHEAILEVMASVGYVQKETNTALRYSYASEAALIRALRPAMVKNGIFCYVLDIPSTHQDTFETAKGSIMNRTLSHGVVRFVHALTDTFIDVHAVGEGMDTGDKSANKAATGLLKYALRQTFLIETGDDPDATSSDEQERPMAHHFPGLPIPTGKATTPKTLTAEEVRKFIWRLIEKNEGPQEVFTEESTEATLAIIGSQLENIEADSRAASLDVLEYLSGNRDPGLANYTVWQAIGRWLALGTEDGRLIIKRAEAVEEIRRVYAAYGLGGVPT